MEKMMELTLKGKVSLNQKEVYRNMINEEMFLDYEIMFILQAFLAYSLSFPFKFKNSQTNIPKITLYQFAKYRQK